MNMFREALLLFRRASLEKSRSLQMRLFAFFALFAAALVGLGFLIFTVTGVFNTAERRHITWLDTETRHLQESITIDFNKLSLRGIALARTLSSQIDLWAEENPISESGVAQVLANHPEMLESLLSETAGELLAALDNNVCSGVFLVLDSDTASLEPQAGLYFKRTATNNVTALSSKTYCLRGPASIARINKAELIGQWRAEFDVSDRGFYNDGLETARQNSGRDLSRLYFWSYRYLMEGDSEHGVRLCVPLIARDGTVYGICGIEISAMMFKTLYTPDAADYPRAFTVFVPLNDSALNTEAGLLAGNSYLASSTNGLLSEDVSHREASALDSWIGDDDAVYTGRMESLALYPTDSPFIDARWAFALLMPKEDWEGVTGQSKIIFYGAFAMLFALSLFAAVFISRRYIRPVVSALELIKTDKRTDLPKTRITEIDDLLEYLTALDEEHKTLNEEAKRYAAGEDASYADPADISASAAYIQFRQNLETLTISEHAVFNLYMKNLSAQQIANKLFVSINTIKFHNRNIYSKLGISSLKELKLYVNIMKEDRK